MKTTVSVYVDIRVAQLLEQYAQANHMSVSRAAAEILGAWADKQNPAAAVKTQVPLTLWERAMLSAIDGLTAQHAALERENPRWGERIFPLNELVKQAGLYPSQALAGLRGLERKGVLKCFMGHRTADAMQGRDDAPEVEHWCRVDGRAQPR